MSLALQRRVLVQDSLIAGDHLIDRAEMRRVRDSQLRADIGQEMTEEEFQETMKLLDDPDDQMMASVKASWDRAYKGKVKRADRDHDGQWDLEEWLLNYQSDLDLHNTNSGHVNGRVFIDRDLRSLERLWCKQHYVAAHVPESMKTS